MIILDTTTRKLQALLSGAPATNQLPIVASYVDLDLGTSVFSPDTNVLNTNSATPVDVAAAPALNTERQIKFITFQNADTAQVTLTVRYDDNGTTYDLWQGTLAAGSTLQYTDGHGFSVINNTGAVLAGSVAVFANQAANTIFAGPASGAAAQPAFRALVPLDLGTGAASSAVFLRGDLTWSNTLTGVFNQTGNSIVSAPGIYGSGSWFTGGTTTTTKPYLLIEPAGTTSNNWNTLGTGFGLNAPALFVGDLMDIQINGIDYFQVFGGANGAIAIGPTPAHVGIIRLATNSSIYYRNSTDTGDILLISWDVSDNVTLGDGTHGLATASLLTASNGISVPTGKDITGAGTAQVTGFATVSATTLTGTLSTAAQPNVTSLDSGVTANWVLASPNGLAGAMTARALVAADLPAGTGTVVSVGLTLPNIFTVTVSPITTSGSLTAVLATQSANTVFAGPNMGVPAAPTFRSLVTADIPNLDAGIITSGTIATARLGTGTANSTVFLRGDQTWSNTLTGPFIAQVAEIGQSTAFGSAYAEFSQSTLFGSSTTYGVLHKSSGELYLNANSGVAIHQRVNNVDQFAINTGAITIIAANSLGWAPSTDPTATPDLTLYRDGANLLGLRNSTNPQRFNLYNTFTDASNWEHLNIRWFSNAAYILTDAVGTGSHRDLHIGTSGAAEFNLFVNGSDRWKVSTSGHLLAVTDNTYDIGASGANRPRTGYFGTSLQVGGATYGSVANPQLALNFASAANTVSSSQFNFFGNNQASAAHEILLQRSRSTTVGGFTAVAANDAVGYVLGYGADGTTFTPAAYISMFVDGTVSSGVVPGRLEINTYNSAGSAKMAIRVDSNQVTQFAPVPATVTGIGASAASYGAAGMVIESADNSKDIVYYLATNSVIAELVASTGASVVVFGAYSNHEVRIASNNTGNIRLTSTTLGFYGVSPVARQLLATGAGHTVDDVITSLQNLGLLRQS